MSYMTTFRPVAKLHIKFAALPLKKYLELKHAFTILQDKLFCSIPYQ